MARADSPPLLTHCVVPFPMSRRRTLTDRYMKHYLTSECQRRVNRGARQFLNAQRHMHKVSAHSNQARHEVAS